MRSVTDRPRAYDLKAVVAAFLNEDLGSGDITTAAVVPPDVHGRARIEVRGTEVVTVAGTHAARCCFEVAANGDVEWDGRADGDRIQPGEVVAHVSTRLAPLLAAERTALNLLGALTGVATLTARYVEAVEGTKARILDTRKTTPGLRHLQKSAVAAGGGTNHRMGLDDAVLIKDNHIAAAGGIVEAVRRVRTGAPGLPVEVEAETLEQVEQAADAGVDVILLDNMSVDEVRAAVAGVAGRSVLEASGGITLDNVREYALTGVELISIGALTHSAPWADLSLEVEATWS